LAKFGVLRDRYHLASYRKLYLWTHSRRGSKPRSPNPNADTSSIKIPNYQYVGF
jgi:hypothetical protein